MPDAFLIDRVNDVVIGPFTGKDAFTKALDYADSNGVDGGAYARSAINWNLGVRRVLPRWYQTHMSPQRKPGRTPQAGRWMFT